MGGDGKTADLSSTRVRAEFARRGCTPLVVDDLVRQRVLGPAVGECLKQKFADAKEVDCICCEATGDLFGTQCPLCDGLARSPVDESDEKSNRIGKGDKKSGRRGRK